MHQIGELLFTWDERKNRANFKKHGVAFQEAATCWQDDFAVEVYDEKHSAVETRWLVIDKSAARRLLICWYTERDWDEQQVLRLIGARPVTILERERYYENAKKR